MIAEALEKLHEYSENDFAKFVRLDSDPKHVHRVLTPDGGFGMIESPPGANTIDCRDVIDVINIANLNSEAETAPIESAANAAIFFDSSMVTYVPDTVRTQDIVSCRLVNTTAYQWLEERLANPFVAPSELREAMLTRLRTTRDDAVQFAKLVGDFRKRTDEEEARSRSHSAVKAEARALPTDGDELIESSQVFEIPMFRNPSVQFKPFAIEVFIDPEVDQGKLWRVTITQEAMDDMIKYYMTLLRKFIADNLNADIPIIFGEFGQD